MKVQVNIIPHKNQVYDTCGYYEIKDDTIVFDISDTSNDMYNFMVLIHEMVEWMLTNKKGITGDEITLFDRKFEYLRKEGNTDEAGDDKYAPYHNEHCIATGIERIVCGALEIPWQEYDKTINELQ